MATFISITQILLLQMSLFMRNSVDSLTCSDMEDGATLSVTLIGRNDCDRYINKNFNTLKIRYKTTSKGLLDYHRLITKNKVFEDGEVNIQIVPNENEIHESCLPDTFFHKGFRPLLSINNDETTPIKMNTLTIELTKNCDMKISADILEGVSRLRKLQLIVPGATLTLNELLIENLSSQPTLLSIHNANYVTWTINSSEDLPSMSNFSIHLNNVTSISSDVLSYFLTETSSFTLESGSATSTDCECSWIKLLSQDKIFQTFSRLILCSSKSEEGLEGSTLTTAWTHCRNLYTEDLGTSTTSADVASHLSSFEQESTQDENKSTPISKTTPIKVATSSTMVLTVVALAAVLCIVILAVLVGLACRRRTIGQRSQHETTIKYGPIQNKDKQPPRHPQQSKYVENGHFVD